MTEEAPGTSEVIGSVSIAVARSDNAELVALQRTLSTLMPAQIKEGRARLLGSDVLLLTVLDHHAREAEISGRMSHIEASVRTINLQYSPRISVEWSLFGSGGAATATIAPSLLEFAMRNAALVSISGFVSSQEDSLDGHTPQTPIGCSIVAKSSSTRLALVAESDEREDGGFWTRCVDAAGGLLASVATRTDVRLEVAVWSSDGQMGIDLRPELLRSVGPQSIQIACSRWRTTGSNVDSLSP